MTDETNETAPLDPIETLQKQVAALTEKVEALTAAPVGVQKAGIQAGAQGAEMIRYRQFDQLAELIANMCVLAPSAVDEDADPAG